MNPTKQNKNFFKDEIRDLIGAAVKKTYPEVSEIAPHVEYPAQEDRGDYATNIAMQLTKEIGSPPRKIAEKILENMGKTELVEKADVAGPGFINFFISRKALEEETKRINEKGGDYGKLQREEKRPVILEYSAPNIAKPLGVHHLLSTIIGQSLYNIFKEAGYETLSINHIGDWGTQFGKLIYAYEKWGDEETIKKSPISEFLKLYVKFHEEAEQNPELEDEARKEFRKFEEGNERNRELWKWFVEESMKEINKTYERLGGMHFDYTQGESFYEEKMDDILEDGKKKGVFEKGDEGAFVINYEDENIPTVPIQKKDGTTLYMTRDFATLKYRIERWDPYRILYVVDVAQSLHFKQLFLGAERLGWYDGERAEHILFGRMHMKDGGMSTRKGNVILLEEVLDEAVLRAEKIVEEKNPGLADKKEVAEKVGIGAVKYNILSQNRMTDITFEWDRMLSLEGNSAPYLQYSYARAKSILRKAESAEAPAGERAEVKTESEKSGLDDAENPQSTDPVNPKPENLKPADSEPESGIAEKTAALMRLFPRYKERLESAVAERKPNILANYLYELAQRFNSFYNAVPVLTAETEEKNARLEVVSASAQLIKNGLELLGVEVVEEM